MIDPAWFAPEGWVQFFVGVTFLVLAGAVLLWLRGPGQQPHDPPISQEGVRTFALSAGGIGTFALIRAVAGFGGLAVVATLALIVSLAFHLRSRRRATRQTPPDAM